MTPRPNESWQSYAKTDTSIYHLSMSNWWRNSVFVPRIGKGLAIGSITTPSAFWGLKHVADLTFNSSSRNIQLGIFYGYLTLNFLAQGDVVRPCGVSFGTTLRPCCLDALEAYLAGEHGPRVKPTTSFEPWEHAVRNSKQQPRIGAPKQKSRDVYQMTETKHS